MNPTQQLQSPVLKILPAFVPGALVFVPKVWPFKWLDCKKGIDWESALHMLARNHPNAEVMGSYQGQGKDQNTAAMCLAETDGALWGGLGYGMQHFVVAVTEERLSLVGWDHEVSRRGVSDPYEVVEWDLNGARFESQPQYQVTIEAWLSEDGRSRDEAVPDLNTTVDRFLRDLYLFIGATGDRKSSDPIPTFFYRTGDIRLIRLARVIEKAYGGRFKLVTD